MKNLIFNKIRDHASCILHRASFLPLMERRWSVDGASMEDRWSHGSAQIAKLQNCTSAHLHNFARIAAMLLMLVTMSVGQVWGDVAKIAFNDGQKTAYSATKVTTSGTKVGDVTVSWATFSISSQYISSSSTKEDALTLNSGASNAWNDKYLDFSSDKPITKIEILAAIPGSSSAANEVWCAWEGSPSATPTEYAVFSVPGKGATTLTTINFSSANIKHVRLYRQPKLNEGTFDSKGTSIGSSTTWGVAYAQVTTSSSSKTSTSINGSDNVEVGKTATYTEASSIAGTWSVTNGTGSATINATTGVLSATTAGTVTVKFTPTNGTTYATSTKAVTITPTVVYYTVGGTAGATVNHSSGTYEVFYLINKKFLAGSVSGSEFSNAAFTIGASCGTTSTTKNITTAGLLFQTSSSSLTYTRVKNTDAEAITFNITNCTQLQFLSAETTASNVVVTVKESDGTSVSVSSSVYPSSSSVGTLYTATLNSSKKYTVDVRSNSGSSRTLIGLALKKAVSSYNVTYNMKGHGDQIAQVTGVTALPNPLPEPTASGWTFDGWYTDEALTQSATAGASISANTTLYAKWTENAPATKTVYFVNVDGWANPTCYNWGTEGTDWPGTAMTNTGDKVGGWDVYSANLKNASNNKCIFSNNSKNQTEDLTINHTAGNYYYYNGTWYADLDAVRAAVHFYLKHPWDGSNWTWKELTDNGDGTYSVEATLGNKSNTVCNWGTNGTSSSGDIAASNVTWEGNPAVGNLCTFTFNPSTKKLTIAKVPTFYDSYLYIHGENVPCGWSQNNPTPFTKLGSGNYVIEDIYLTHAVTNGFKMPTVKDWQPKWMAKGGDKEITTTGTYDLQYETTGSPDYKFLSHSEGHYKLVVKFTSETEGTIQALPVIPANLAVVGPITGENDCWNAGKQKAMSDPVVDGNNKTFTWTKNLAIGNHTFCFCSQLSASDLYLHANQATMTATGCTLEDEDAGATVNEDKYHNFKLGVTTAGVYKITVTYNTTNNTVAVNASPVTYTVNFGAADGCTSMGSVSAKVGDTYDGGTDVQNNKVSEGVTVWFKAIPETGYHFVDWCNKNGSGEKGWSTYNPKSFGNVTYDINMYAKFAVDQYTITYKDQGDAAYSGSNSSSLPATHTYGAATALVDGVRDGYIFDGWFTSSDCTGDAVTSIAATAITANTTLYAKWTEKCTPVLTWKPTLDKEETTVSTTSKSSSDAHLTNLSNITVTGLTVTSGKKTDATNKIQSLESRDASKYVSMTFDVESGYKFTPSVVSLPTTAVSNSKTIEVIISDATNSESQTWAQPASASSTPTEHEYSFSQHAYTGTVTLKIMAYGDTKGFRLGTPITICGEVEDIPVVNYYLKHQFAGRGWTWKQLTDNGDGTYSITDVLGLKTGTVCNWGTNGTSKEGDINAGDITWVGNPNVGDKCTFTYNPSTNKLTITKLDNIYHIYLGQTLTLPEGCSATYDATDEANNVPARYYDFATSSTLQYNRAGALEIDGRSVTGKTLGKYQITLTGARTDAVTVYVYRYYAKYPWGACGMEGEAYNKMWKWAGMDFAEANTVKVYGLYSADVQEHSNLGWDYYYDWDGVYKFDGSSIPNLHPGLDEGSNRGVWIDGKTESMTGGSVYREINKVAGMNCEKYIKLTYEPDHTLCGAEEPILGSSNFVASDGTSEVTANYKELHYGAVPTLGGSVVHNASGDKVAQGTEVTFYAEAADGYIFRGWYNNATCTGEAITSGVADNLYTVEVPEGGVNAYAKFEKYVTSIELHAEGEIIELGVGQTLQLTVTYKPEDATYGKSISSWASDNTNYLTVDGSGLVTAVAEGAGHYITATTSNGKTATYYIDVIAGACEGYSVHMWNSKGTHTRACLERYNGYEYRSAQVTLPSNSDAEQLKVLYQGNHVDGHSAQWTTRWLPMIGKQANNDVPQIYPGQDAVGYFRIFIDSDQPNYFLAFQPTYVLTYGVNGVAGWQQVEFREPASGHEYQTDVVKVPANYFSTANFNCYVGTKRANGTSPFVAGHDEKADRSETFLMKNMTGLKTSDMGGHYGYYKIFDNSADKNWFVSFVSAYAYELRNDDETIFSVGTSKTNSNTTITSETPSKAGYTFLGWDRTKGKTELSGDDKIEAGASYTFWSDLDVFYPVWKANAATELTALVTNTLYKVPDMIPAGSSLTSDDQFLAGISSNTKFELIGLSSNSTTPKVNNATKNNTTIDEIAFNTGSMWFKGNASLTSNTPTTFALKFIVPTGGGQLKLYFGGSTTTIKLAKEGAVGSALTLTNGVATETITAGTYYLYGTGTTSPYCFYGMKLESVAPAPVDPTVTFTDGAYTIGGSALDLSTLFTSNSDGVVTYTVTNANGTGAAVAGSNFTATTAGTATVQASQAATGEYNAKVVTATITVSAAAPDPSGDCALFDNTDAQKTSLPAVDNSAYVSPVTITNKASDNSSTTLVTDLVSCASLKLGGSAQYAEISLAEGYKLSSIEVSFSSGSNDKNYKDVIVYSSSRVWDAGTIISVSESAAGGAKNAGAKFTHESEAPANALSARIYREYTYNTTKYGQGNSIYVYAINVCYESTGPCTPSSYALMHTDKGEIEAFEATDNANEYVVVFELKNDIVNNLYVEDNCGNTYGSSGYYFAPGECKVLSSDAKFSIGGASQDKHWKFTFNSETKRLCLDAQAEEDKTYSITYECDGATSGCPANVASAKTLPSPLATPEKTGYTFNGWFTNSDKTVAAVAGATLTANVTLYAKWTENTYTVTVNDPETTCSRVINNVRKGQQVTITNTCEVPGKTLTGYNSTPAVSGTFNAGTGTYTFIMPAEDVTLDAVWVAAGTHTITFHKNDGGSTTATQEDVPDNVATALTAMNTIGWSRTGYTFTGWNTVAGGTGTAYADGANITATANVTLYAQWTKNQYTVTLDNQEATTAGTASVTVTYGSKDNLTTAITVPTKTNNEFCGYYTAKNGAGVQVIAADGTFNKDNDYLKADGNWKYLGNVTLYAKWTSTVVTYAITYAANGGSGTMTAAREYEAGETVTIKTNAFTAPANKEFNGWVVTNNSTSEEITVTAGKFTMPASAVTITAQWKDKEVSSCNTMVIYQGLTTTTTGATSGSESNSGATWAVTNGSSTYETVDYTYDGVNYKRGWKIFGGASSASDRFIEIVIPEDYTATFKMVGYITSTGRSAFISTKKTGSLDKSIAYITPATTKTIVGATSAEMPAGTYYFCVTNAFQITELSVEVCPVGGSTCTAPTISAVSATPAAVCAGEEVMLSATATQNNAGTLTYTWYNSDNIEMGTGAEVTVTPEENTTYYCVVAEEGCDKTTKSSTVSVSINAATAITTQPTAATEASVGSTVSLKVVATGSHLSYQWQESANGTDWANVANTNATAKQATLSVKVATAGTMYYRCVVSGDCGNETSAAASITAGAATPTVTWSDVTTVYQGEKVSISVTTNTDAAFDESALTIATENCTVGSKTVVGKTVVAELHINADAAADATITLTFNTPAGASYGATVNNTHTLTVSGECPAGGASGTVYTATMTANTTATATGGEVTVNTKLSSSSTATRGGNTYYKFDSSSKLTLTPEGGFKVGDVLTIDITSSGSNDDGLIIKDASGTQLVDLHEKLSSSKNSLLTYTFTVATDYVTMMRHNSGCYFYGAYVSRVGSLTNLEWNDSEDMIEDGVVTVVPEAENFTLAAASSNSFGAITYSIAPAGVATINTTTGEIDPTNLGTATVTATIAANGCYGEKSITYTLKVADDCVAPIISAHPASATYVVNTTASAMSVTATGTDLTYQWYRNSENNNTSGTAISGATSASYTPDVTVRGTVYYYCEVKSGKCGTLSNVAKIEVTRPACSLPQPKIIEVSRVGGDCWTSITLKAVAQDGTDLDGGTYQWYLDGEAVSTDAQPTITVAGTYTLEYTKDECTVDASNEFKAPSTAPEVGLLSPFQYYHAGKSDYSDQMNGRHLFTYTSQSDAEPTYSATLNEEAMAGDALATLQGALERKEGKNNVDTIMLSLNDLVGCGFVAGDEVVITVTPKNCSNEDVAGEAKSIQLHVVDGRPTLAFIVTGADGAGTKTKKNLKLNGDFLTGYNKADLKVQTSATAVSDAELPLYTALKENYNVVPVNGYAPFSKWNYEPFDLTFLTDFVKTDGTSSADAAKKRVNELAGIVDFRPMLSTKSFVSALSNWAKFGFVATPVVPKQTQKWMNIVCYAHPMFDDFLADGTDKVLEEQADGGTEVVFTMLSQGGFDKSKGLQGFALSDAGAFVNIATCHYNAVADIVTDPETGKKTCQPTSVGADDKLLVASCERQTNIEARMIMLSVNADAMSFLTDEGIDVIILSLNYLLMTNPIDVTDCSVTFLGSDGEDGDDWNVADNWNTGKLPTEKNNVRIAAHCHVKNGKQAVAQSVKILQNCTYGSKQVNGSLVIEPTGALSITGAIGRVEDDNYLDILPTLVEDVTIESSAAGNGALIHGDETGVIQATVEMYSKATGESDTEAGVGYIKNAVWQWMTTPLNAGQEAVNMYYHAWMYSWTNDTHQWNPQVTDHDMVNPFGGYCITQLQPTTYELKGTLATTQDREIQLYKGLNLIGNSWTAPINIGQFEVADFGSAEATVVLFNTGLDEFGVGQKVDASVSDNTAPGTYVSVPVKTAAAVNNVPVIPSMQAFEIKATANTKLELKYDQLVRPASGNVIINPMRAPKRVAEETNTTSTWTPGDNGINERLRIYVQGQHYGDYAYILQHDDATMDFDNGWDGTKYKSDNADIPVLVVRPLSTAWQVSTQAELTGTTVGFYQGVDTTYTMGFDYVGYEDLWMYDKTADVYTKIETGNTYNFSSNASHTKMQKRFFITDYNPYYVEPSDPNSGITTGIINLDEDGNQLTFSNTTHEAMTICVYDASGKLCEQVTTKAPLYTVTLPSVQGVYMIHAKAGDQQVTRKVVR